MMKMVKDNSSRQVTFSKRKTGLFKKAHDELATLCAAQIAIVAFSPGEKPFSFGNPGVLSVAHQRFLNKEKRTKLSSNLFSSRAEAAARMEKLNGQLEDLKRQIQIEKKKEQVLEVVIKGKSVILPESTDELLEMKKAMEELRANMRARVVEMEMEMEMEASSSSSSSSSSLLLLSKKPVQEN